VVVTNNGPSDVTNAPVTDPVATGLTIGNWTCTITAQGTGTVVPACGAASGSGPLNTTVTLRNGGSATYVIAAHVDATSGSITNTATVKPPAGTIPPASGSLCTVQAAPNARTYNAATGLCSASDTDTVQPIADLLISKNDGVTQVVSGTSTTYTIVVTNGGPSAANNAVVTDPVATGLNKTAAACIGTTGGAACPASTTVALLQGTGVIIPTFPAGATVTFTVTATVSATGGTVTNNTTVAVPAGTIDPTPGNNTASDTDQVIPASCFLGNPATNQAYPYVDATHPLTNTVFNESMVLKKSEPTIAVAGGTIRMWYNDEHALALGIRQVTGGPPAGQGSFPVTDFPKTNAAMIAFGAPSGTLALSAGVDAAGNPVPAYPGGPNLPLLTGTHTCPGGCDPAQRPIAPALFCTDITDANTNRGDWQIVGGTNGYGGHPPDFVSGTWKSATSTVNASNVPSTTVDADPQKNVTKTSTPITWVAGPGADVPQGGYDTLRTVQGENKIESYGTEIRWNVNNTDWQCYDAVTGAVTTGLTPGRIYRVQFLVHDGDQNNAGGDSAQACAIIAR
jgi:uncharacterized repeat protein (TIGR01451 family)